MDASVPYMPSVGNLSKILDKIQNAGVPENFNIDFLKDLGFTSSNDRGVIKLLKYVGLLDAAGRPQSAYREFMDGAKAKTVLASRLRTAYDDLFLADREAHTKTVQALKGWFKTKTGESDSVAEKIASTFKALATYGDFSAAAVAAAPSKSPSAPEAPASPKPAPAVEVKGATGKLPLAELGFVYRLEIHLPDTQNVETFRAIFRALREEMMG